MKQILMFDEVASQTKFDKYNAENPKVYEGFKKFTFEAIAAGRKYLGAELIINRLRWETVISGNDRFKINNNYEAFYSRLFMRDFPEYKGFFRTRKSKADNELG